MFGYIVPKVCELKVREYELFRAYYCGLCKALKSGYKKTAVLNFDSVFLYLLADSLREDATAVEPCKCGLHPFEKRQKVVSDAAAYAADVNILMAYCKAQDDVHDKGKGRLVQAFLKKAYHKAAEKHPHIAEVAAGTIDELHRLEEEKTTSTDAVADTYARLLGTVFEDADVLQSHVLYDLGYSLGRWVYLIDAAEDWEKDAAAGEYNVYLYKYRQRTQTAKEEILRSLQYSLAQASQALERLTLKKNKELLQNIIYLGLREQTERIVDGEPRMTAQVR
ncbi:MAG: DUF5685 family protein [Christensenella sp.]|uniref:DUF5685 family protein n=1 Tax=Christensenella sp. TaxID=1935934 RepID=UPI002B20D362|nr:DUF5685 family protein [Christensenella sp.]MEA5002317.1 DUF5685 family protein [Christensenella sp.]